MDTAAFIERAKALLMEEGLTEKQAEAMAVLTVILETNK